VASRRERILLSRVRKEKSVPDAPGNDRSDVFGIVRRPDRLPIPPPRKSKRRAPSAWSLGRGRGQQKMTTSVLSSFISRLDFAWITTFHIIYPPLTIGLAAMLFIAEWRWVATQDPYWYRLCRFFEKLFVVNFGAGVATGVTMEMAFGILYGPFSQAAGPFFGQVLGYETITAFMYEAGFIGLMLFGWGKISRGVHLFATFNVEIGRAHV